MKTLIASPIKFTVLLPEANGCNYNLSRRVQARRQLRLKKHTDLRSLTSPTLLNCDINISLLMLPAPKARDFVELILLYHPSVETLFSMTLLGSAALPLSFVGIIPNRVFFILLHNIFI